MRLYSKLFAGYSNLPNPRKPTLASEGLLSCSDSMAMASFNLFGFQLVFVPYSGLKRMSSGLVRMLLEPQRR